MPPTRSLAAFLHDLRAIEKAPAAAEVIVDALMRHTSLAEVAVYLREGREGEPRLCAASAGWPAPELLGDGGGMHLVPLQSGREHLGVIALPRPPADETDLDTLDAGASFVSTLLINHRLSQEAREGDFQLKYRLWELESLYDIGLSIASTLNIDELADEILFRMISLTNARRAALFLREGGGLRLYRSFGEPAIDDGLVDVMMQQGSSLSGDGTVVALPISGNNEMIGVLAAADRETKGGGIGSFDDNDLRLLSSFASQVGIALENARLHRAALEKQAMERELELAATIQHNILPKSIPIIEGLELAALSRPARQVGGDYHAFFERDGVLTILVADVAGKSMPAALLVSALHAAVQLLFAEGRELGEIATELNRHIHRWSADNKFVTMIMASIDREAGTIRFVNAGHNPGYVVMPDKLETLKSHGLPIGILGQSKYVAQTRPFPPGSTVVLYSDGITEAENAEGEEFGNERLEPLLGCDEDASALRDRIAAAVDAFVGETPQKDDQTMVIGRLNL